jgi:hypothetical protein
MELNEVFFIFLHNHCAILTLYNPWGESIFKLSMKLHQYLEQVQSTHGTLTTNDQADQATVIITHLGMHTFK